MSFLQHKNRVLLRKQNLQNLDCSKCCEKMRSARGREPGGPNRRCARCALCLFPLRSGAGGIGEEKILGCQEEEEGSKMRRRIGVRGGPVEGVREEGGKTTLTQCELIMHQLIAHRNDQKAFFPSFLAWVILFFLGSFRMDFLTYFCAR